MVHDGLLYRSKLVQWAQFWIKDRYSAWSVLLSFEFKNERYGCIFTQFASLFLPYSVWSNLAVTSNGRVDLCWRAHGTRHLEDVSAKRIVFHNTVLSCEIQLVCLLDEYRVTPAWFVLSNGLGEKLAGVYPSSFLEEYISLRGRFDPVRRRHQKGVKFFRFSRNSVENHSKTIIEFGFS